MGCCGGAIRFSWLDLCGCCGTLTVGVSVTLYTPRNGEVVDDGNKNDEGRYNSLVIPVSIIDDRRIGSRCAVAVASFSTDFAAAVHVMCHVLTF